MVKWLRVLLTKDYVAAVKEELTTLEVTIQAEEPEECLEEIIEKQEEVELFIEK
jgi:hypothetical protein